MLKSLKYSALISSVPILIFLTWYLYYPGLTGGFLLDDFVNLQSLKTFSNNGFFYYLAQGNAGTLGRPVSMLSFLLNDVSWPSKAEYFLRTNLLLHILCALSVYWFTYKLLKLLRLSENNSAALAFLTAFVWAIHPLNISTVLYTIQRMTQLSMLFSFWSLIAYVYTLENIDNKKGLIFFPAFLVFVALAVLSKENGILVLGLAILLEKVVKAPRNNAWFERGKISFIYFPMGLLVAYFVVKFPSIQHSYELRDFTLAERMLTEARILVDYILSIVLPFKVDSSLYYDNIELSSGLFTPITTFSSILFIFSSVLLVSIYRNAAPVIFFGLLWFFIGHSLESTFLPLELYFEHRNYLPSVGIILGAIFLAFKLVTVFKDFILRFFVGVVFLSVLIYVGFLSSLLIKTWGNEGQLIYTWAHQKEDSYRAQSEFTQLIALQGYRDAAIKILQPFAESKPDNLTVRARLAAFECEYRGSIDTEHVAYFMSEKSHYEVNRDEAFAIMKRYIRLYKMQSCPELNFDLVQTLFDDIRLHDDVRKAKRYLAVLSYTQGNFLAELGLYERAMELLDQAASLQNTVDVPMRQVVLALQAREGRDAQRYLEIAKTKDANRGWRYPSRATELQQLEKLVDRSLKLVE